jgi:hypothetical protein
MPSHLVVAAAQAVTQELVVAVAQEVVVAAFDWLAKNAAPLWHSIRRWWGGEAAKKKVWDFYKNARNAIMSLEQNHDMRLYLIQDLRQECRMKYPAYASLWN